MIPFVVVTVLFFLWGIANNLNDILIRQFMKSFNINRSHAGDIQLWFYLGYFALAIPAAQLMRRFGYKMGIVTGLCLLGAGCWMFYPAAQAGLYTFFLVAQFVIASGLSFLGNRRKFFYRAAWPRRLQRAALEILPRPSTRSVPSPPASIGTVFIFSGIKMTDAQVAAMQIAGTYKDYLHSETLRVVAPYMVLGTVAFIWAILVLMTKFPVLGGEEPSSSSSPATENTSLLQPHFVFAVVAQFLYVGAQVGTWSYFIPYVESATGVGDKAAGYMLTGTLAAFAIGRFSSAWLMRHFHAQMMLVVYSVMNVVLGLVAVARPGWLGAMCLLTTSTLHVHHVPNHLRAGPQRHGRKNQDRRLAAGDGHPGWRSPHQAHGLSRRQERIASCLHRASRLLRGNSTLWLAGPRTKIQPNHNLGAYFGF